MAYSHGGTIQWGTDDPSNTEFHWAANATIMNDNYGLGIKLDKSKDRYYIYAKPLNSGVTDKNLYYVINTRAYKHGNIIETHTVNAFFNIYPSKTSLNTIDTGTGSGGVIYNNEDIHISGIPIFDKDESLKKYLENQYLKM